MRRIREFSSGRKTWGQGLEVEWRVAMRPGHRRRLESGSDEGLAKREKAPLRAKVEHTFLRVKRPFGFGKERYWELAKNGQCLEILLRQGNLLTAEGRLRG